MDLPTDIIVGQHTYTVKEKDMEWADHAEEYGHCDHANLSIAVVKASLPNSQVINTVVHELLHAVWNDYDLPREHEEHIVTCMANGLCQVFRDNKELLKLLGKL